MENISLKNFFKKKSILTMAVIFIPGILFLAIMFWLTKKNNIPFEIFSRDPIQTLNGKPYIGILSNIGIIFWCATSAILFYSSKISALLKRPESETSFLFFGGLITILLLVDDLFLIHDVVFPEYLKIDEKVFFVFYGLSLIALVFYYRAIVLKTDYILLVIAFASFGSSVLTDIIDALGIDITQLYVFEDGLKFLGIISWFAYFTRTSFRFIRGGLKSASGNSQP
jgi:hypothetical protein